MSFYANTFRSTSFFSMATQWSIVLRYNNLTYCQSFPIKNYGTIGIYIFVQLCVSMG